MYFSVIYFKVRIERLCISAAHSYRKARLYCRIKPKQMRKSTNINAPTKTAAAIYIAEEYFLRQRMQMASLHIAAPSCGKIINSSV